MPSDQRQPFLDTILKRFDQLRQGDTLPGQLDDWRRRKDELRKQLVTSWGGFPAEKSPLEPRTLGVLNREGYRIEKVVFQTLPGVWMTANLYLPDRPGPLPAVLCVHGHWKGAKQDPVPQARCIGLAKLGFVVLAVDAFGAGERAVGKALGEYHGEMTGATLLPTGLTLPGIQVYENMRAADFLQSRPEVDGTRLGITGASGGGNQSMYAGAFDERFGVVVPTCSVGTYRSYLGAACCVCELVPAAMTYTEEWALLALVAPRALMVISASRDAFQFSVGQAQLSVAKAQHVFRLHDKAHFISHPLFESGHDYGKAMREAMYGWMTLHLKGEGQGNPIPEPAHQVEEPETLRCWPGETRPDTFVTLPQYAGQEGARLRAGHRSAWPTHKPMWESHAMLQQHLLQAQVLGGAPLEKRTPRRVAEETTAAGLRIERIEPEPGLEIRLVIKPGQPDRGHYVIFDLAGAEASWQRPLAQQLSQSGATVTCTDLRVSGHYAASGDKIGQAPDHNTAEWAIWVGRPLLGQWIADALISVQFLADQLGATRAKMTLLGLGPASLIALGAGLYDPKIPRVGLVGGLASFVTTTPYREQWLGVMAPGILRDVGDIPHLAALLTPRRLVIAGAVQGDAQPLSREALDDAFTDTRSIHRLYGNEGHLSLLGDLEPADLAKRLIAGEQA